MTLPALKPRVRFSIRANLVLMTLVAIWLGYSTNWIKQRRALRTSDRIEFYKLGLMTERLRLPACFGFSENQALAISLLRIRMAQWTL
jgi:hypothetical protein